MRRPINWLVFSMSLLLLFANLMLTDGDRQEPGRSQVPERTAAPGEVEMIVDPDLAQLRTYGDASPAVYVWSEKENH